MYAAVPFGSSTGLDPITQGLDPVTQVSEGRYIKSLTTGDIFRDSPPTPPTPPTPPLLSTTAWASVRRRLTLRSVFSSDNGIDIHFIGQTHCSSGGNLAQFKTTNIPRSAVDRVAAILQSLISICRVLSCNGGKKSTQRQELNGF